MNTKAKTAKYRRKPALPKARQNHQADAESEVEEIADGDQTYPEAHGPKPRYGYQKFRVTMKSRDRQKRCGKVRECISSVTSQCSALNIPRLN